MWASGSYFLFPNKHRFNLCRTSGAGRPAAVGNQMTAIRIKCKTDGGEDHDCTFPAALRRISSFLKKFRALHEWHRNSVRGALGCQALRGAWSKNDWRGGGSDRMKGLRGRETGGCIESARESGRKRGGGKGFNFLWKHPLFPWAHTIQKGHLFNT